MNSVLEEIYEKYHSDLFHFLMYMVKNREQAEDLTQEVYIRVLKSYRHFEGKSTEKTWLIAIAKNVAIDFFRKEKGWKGKIQEAFDWDHDQIKDDTNKIPEEIALQNEEMRMLYHSLDYCTLDQKMVIVMRYLNEMSIRETAEVLKGSESKVKTTQHRGIKTLQKAMNEIKKRGE
jgi:RNA polymerase sigma-70 factor, ECF subfamily